MINSSKSSLGILDKCWPTEALVNVCDVSRVKGHRDTTLQFVIRCLWELNAKFRARGNLPRRSYKNISFSISSFCPLPSQLWMFMKTDMEEIQSGRKKHCIARANWGTICWYCSPLSGYHCWNIFRKFHFDSRPGSLTSWLRLFVALLVPSRKVQSCFIKTGHDP